VTILACAKIINFLFCTITSEKYYFSSSVPDPFSSSPLKKLKCT
jgi:hypothetical protein